MPELPEVETICRGLNRDLIGRKIIDIWTDWPKYFSVVNKYSQKSFKLFRLSAIGKKVTKVGRRAKNVLIYLGGESRGEYLLLVHQKMSGHLMIGKWLRAKSKKDYDGFSEKWIGQKWVPVLAKEPFIDLPNRFIRVIFFLDNGEMLALSDLRRFARIVYGKSGDVLGLPEIAKLGPEPLEKEFSYKRLTDILDNKKGEIKKLLLNPYTISGIGNIYADEILWLSKIHPKRRVENLKTFEKKALYGAIKKILNLALKLKGSSIDDYRDHKGQKGAYSAIRLAYQRDGEPCGRCGKKIIRLKISGRSAHFCPRCQKI